MYPARLAVAVEKRHGVVGEGCLKFTANRTLFNPITRRARGSMLRYDWLN